MRSQLVTNMTPESPLDFFFSAVYPTLSLLWGTLWLMVAFHYGGAAWATWKLEGASWRRIFCDIFDPLMHAVMSFICRFPRLAKLLRIHTPKYAGGMVPTTSPGNILRFAIFVASMTPISFGFAFAFIHVWHEDIWKLLLTLLFMTTSILGALGHLFLANRGNPRRWSNIVMLSIVWTLLAPILFNLWRY